MTQSNAGSGSLEDESLAQLKLAATIGEEASRWLRNCLVRLRAGHELDFEIESAERALQDAIAQIRGEAPPRSSKSPGGQALRIWVASTAGARGLTRKTPGGPDVSARRVPGGSEASI